MVLLVNCSANGGRMAVCLPEAGAALRTAWMMDALPNEVGIVSVSENRKRPA